MPAYAGSGTAVVHNRGDVDMQDKTTPPKTRQDRHTATFTPPSNVYTLKILRAQLTIPSDTPYAVEASMKCFDWEYEWTNIGPDGAMSEGTVDWAKASGYLRITLRGPKSPCKV